MKATSARSSKAPGASPPSNTLVRRLHDMTEGNPFFLNEVLRQMAAEGRLANDASSVPTRLTIPRGVIEFIKNLIQPLDAGRAQRSRNRLGDRTRVRRSTASKPRAATPRESSIDLLDRASVPRARPRDERRSGDATAFAML